MGDCTNVLVGDVFSLSPYTDMKAPEAIMELGNSVGVRAIIGNYAENELVGMCSNNC